MTLALTIRCYHGQRMWAVLVFVSGMRKQVVSQTTFLGKPKNGYSCIPLITQGQPSRPRSLPTETFMIYRSEHLSHHLPILFRHRVPEGPMMGHTGLVPAFSAFPILMSS